MAKLNYNRDVRPIVASLNQMAEFKGAWKVRGNADNSWTLYFEDDKDRKDIYSGTLRECYCYVN